MPFVIAGHFGNAGILHLKATLDILKQTRLHAQERLGIVVEVGVVICPRTYRHCEKGHGQG